jgi:dolichyl-phosphate-mannose--protein O-mannosyl transferase
MLIAAAGYLTGYDGQFPFENPGDQYDFTNFVGMRVVRADIRRIVLIHQHYLAYCLELFYFG